MQTCLGSHINVLAFLDQLLNKLLLVTSVRRCPLMFLDLWLLHEKEISWRGRGRNNAHWHLGVAANLHVTVPDLRFCKHGFHVTMHTSILAPNYSTQV